MELPGNRLDVVIYPDPDWVEPIFSQSCRRGFLTLGDFVIEIFSAAGVGAGGKQSKLLTRNSGGLFFARPIYERSHSARSRIDDSVEQGWSGLIQEPSVDVGLKSEIGI